MKTWWLNINYKGIVIAGHGIAGVIAQYLSISLKNRAAERNIMCYNFGTPKPGNYIYEKVFEMSQVDLCHMYIEDDPYIELPYKNQYPSYKRLVTEKKIKIKNNGYKEHHHIDVYLKNINNFLINF